MTKPVRIQRSRQKKAVSPNGLPIVYVGRQSMFGNPYILYRDGNQEEVVRKYKNEFFFVTSEEGKEYTKQKLKGKNLSCWCKLSDPCHADILLEVANS